MKLTQRIYKAMEKFPRKFELPPHKRNEIKIQFRCPWKKFENVQVDENTFS